MYQAALVEYSEDAILVQTTSTLSDERSTSKDDAEAKYSRVVGSAMLLLAKLIQNIENEKDEKRKPDFAASAHAIITNKKLWEFAYHTDPYLRKACCHLVDLCATSFPFSIDWPAISTSLVAKGLTATQLGSSGVYLEALLFLTRKHPSIWTSHYHAKTAASKKFLQFVGRGSQRGREDFWANLNALIKILPREAISTSAECLSLEDATALATALRDGLASHEEPRQNWTAAWSCYIDICFWLQGQLDVPETRNSFLRAHLVPVVPMYANPSSKTSVLPGPSALQLATSVLVILSGSGFEGLFVYTWDDTVRSLVDRMKLSLPETSKDFVASQDAVIAHSSRLRKLQQAVLKNMPDGTLDAIALCFRDGQVSLTQQSIELLENRSGKPYGAAAVLQDLFSDTEPSSAVRDFLDHNISDLLESPSAERLVTLWTASGRNLAPLIKELSNRQKLNSYGEKAFSQILASAKLSDVTNLPLVRELTSETPAVTINPQHHLFIKSLLQNPAVASSDWKHTLVDSLLKDLSTDAPADAQTSMLKLIDSFMGDYEAKVALISGRSGNELHARLLALAESDDSNTSEQASTILAKLQTSSVNSAFEETRAKSLIQDQLAGAQPQLSILSLVDLALAEIQKADDKAQAVRDLMPSINDWESAISAHSTHAHPFGAEHY